MQVVKFCGRFSRSCFFLRRALNLAVQHRTHVDTVLAFRHRYLEQTGQVETIKKFTQYMEKVYIFTFLGPSLQWLVNVVSHSLIYI